MINISLESIPDLSKITFEEKIVIFDSHKNESNESIKLWLEKTINIEGEKISLNGITYKNNVMQKSTVLSYYAPDFKNISNIKNTCSCYSFDEMYRVIMSRGMICEHIELKA